MNDQECIQNNSCKNCGGYLERVSVHTYRCKFCLHTYTACDDALLPEAKRLLLLGQDDLDNSHFEDAYAHFSKAALISENEPEIYWGLALAKRKIRYLKDYRNTKDSKEKFRLQPICYEPMAVSFSKDENFLKAVELARDEKQRESYLERAREIDYIQKKFIEYSKDDRYHFDCFICVKVTELDDTERFTADSHYADNIYTFLQKNGICPFYSEKVAKEYAGADYEALILYALSRASSFLMVVSDERYLETPWVKNEYTRYLSMVKDQKKEEDSIVICYKDNPIQKLSIEDHVRQGIDLKSPSAFFDLLQFVRTHQNTAMQPILLKEYQENKIAPKTFAKKKVVHQSFAMKNAEVDVSQDADVRVVRQMIIKGQETSAKIIINNALKKNNQFSKMYYLRYQIDHDLKDLLSAFSCATKEEYQEYFDEKLQNMASSFDSEFYRSFVSLQNAGQTEIDRLNEKCHDILLLSDDENLIRLYLSTLSSEKDYVDALVKLSKRAKKKEDKIHCLTKALEYAPDQEKIRYDLFLLKHDMSFLLEKENQSQVEEELFSYGYNAYASSKLYSYAIKKLKENSKRDKVVSFLSFLISLMPKEDPEVKQRVLEIISNLKFAGLFEEAKPFLLLLLSLEPDNDEYYLEMVMVKNHVLHPAMFLFEYKSLAEDEDYLNCVRFYAEKYPQKDNKYLELISQFEQIQQIWDSSFEEEYKSFAIKKHDFSSLFSEFVSHMKEHVVSLLDHVMMEHNCTTFSVFETLPIDCSNDPGVLEAKRICDFINQKSGNNLLEYPPILNYILFTQASRLKFNQNREKYKKIYHALSLWIPILVLFLSLIGFIVLPSILIDNIRLLSLPTLIPIWIGAFLIALVSMIRHGMLMKRVYTENDLLSLQILCVASDFVSYLALFALLMLNQSFLLTGHAFYLNGYAVLLPLLASQISMVTLLNPICDEDKVFNKRVLMGFLGVPLLSLAYSLSIFLTMGFFGIYQMDLSYQITHFIIYLLLALFCTLSQYVAVEDRDDEAAFFSLSASLSLIISIPLGYFIASSLFNLFPLTFTLSAAIFQTVLTLAFGFGFIVAYSLIEDSM